MGRMAAKKTTTNKCKSAAAGISRGAAVKAVKKPTVRKTRQTGGDVRKMAEPTLPLQLQVVAHNAIAMIPKGMAAGRSVLKIISESLTAFAQATGYSQAAVLELSPDETCLFPLSSTGEAAALLDTVSIDEPLEIMAERSVSKILGKAWSSGACLPLAFQDTPLGLLCLGGGRSSRPDALLKQLLELFSQQLSLCLYTRNLSEYKDLEVDPRDISRTELCGEDVPSIPEFDTSLHLLRGSGAGGDFHAFIPLTNGRTGILFGKVSGGGKSHLDLQRLVPAVRDHLCAGGTLPEVTQRINDDIIRHGNRSQLVSVVLMIVDSRTRKARICRAGSVKMLRFKGGELSVFDEALGPHLGAFSGVRLQEVELQFAPGDSLALMTDGINLFSEKKSAPLENLAEKLASRMATHKGVGLTGQVVALLKEKHLSTSAEVTVLGLQRKLKVASGSSSIPNSVLAE